MRSRGWADSAHAAPCIHGLHGITLRQDKDGDIAHEFYIVGEDNMLDEDLTTTQVTIGPFQSCIP